MNLTQTLDGVKLKKLFKAEDAPQIEHAFNTYTFLSPIGSVRVSRRKLSIRNYSSETEKILIRFEHDIPFQQTRKKLKQVSSQSGQGSKTNLEDNKKIGQLDARLM